MKSRDRIFDNYTAYSPCVIGDGNPGWNVWLKVEGQQFSVTTFACETLDEVKLARDMLAKAIMRLLELEGE